MEIETVAFEGLAAGAVTAPFISTSAVARVRLRYRRAGKVSLASPGSGFVIEEWPEFLITARHVVRVPSGGTAIDFRVTFASAQGSQVLVGAVAAAYPTGDDASDDLAVVRLSAPSQGPLIVTADSWPSDGEAVAGRAVGFPLGENAERSVDLKIRRKKDWLIYEAGMGRGGMSGGPVLRDERLIGVHVRQKAALLTRFETVLDACLAAIDN